MDSGAGAVVVENLDGVDPSVAFSRIPVVRVRGSTDMQRNSAMNVGAQRPPIMWPSAVGNAERYDVHRRG
jgi:hypothetical protein